MKKFSIIAKTVVLTMGMMGTVYADTGSQQSLLNSWTGFYIGANAGVAFNNVQLNAQQLGFSSLSQTYNASSNFSTFFPGLQVGYMHQFPSDFVSGIEANLSVNTNQTDTLTYPAPYNNPGYDQFSFENRFQGSIKGRWGHSINWNKNIFLPYVTAGVSFANVGLSYQNEGDDYDFKNTTLPGCLFGVGMEWAFSENWSLRAEYSHVDYGTINLNIPSVFGLIDPNGGAHAKLSSNNLTASINYWF